MAKKTKSLIIILVILLLVLVFVGMRIRQQGPPLKGVIEQPALTTGPTDETQEEAAGGWPADPTVPEGLSPEELAEISRLAEELVGFNVSVSELNENVDLSQIFESE